jgi:hypothetical protein
MALSKDKVKEIADRAEGLKPGTPEAAAGRPSKYQASFARQAEKLCALGATDEDLANFFEVGIRTIANWKSQHEDFLQALKGGKTEADDRVERSLYQRAVGYTFDSEKVFNNKGEIVRAQTREHCPPDVTAQIFWLKNRRPEDWRDKSEVAVTHHYADLSDEELNRELEQAISGGATAH